jgi:Ni/Co efflux regulator RcnB
VPLVLLIRVATGCGDGEHAPKTAAGSGLASDEVKQESRMSRKASLLGITILVSLIALPLSSGSAMAAAQGRGRGQAKKAEKAEAKQGRGNGRQDAVVIDRDGYARVIREYARGGSLPPGLAKRESLPPGLRRQLRERGTLPPGLEKRWIAVPAPLSARLPPVPQYYHRYFAGDDLVVVDTRTNRIAAIIRDVWR